MRFLIAEFKIAIALVVVATVVPLAWSWRDSQRRLALKQTAWFACWSHHDVDECDGLRPSELPTGWLPACEMRFDARQCARLMEGR